LGELKKLSDGVHAYIQSSAAWGHSNSGMISNAGSAVLFDTLFTLDLTKELITEITRVTGVERFDYLALSHHHGDHVFGSEVVAREVTVAHLECSREMERLRPPDPALYTAKYSGFNFEGITFPTVDKVFTSNLTLDLAGKEIQLLHYGPAHTTNDIILWDPEAQVVFCGDLVFNGSIPLCMEGSIGNWITALDNMLQLDAKIYVPGHGAVGGREVVEKCRAYLVMLREQVSQAYEADLPEWEAIQNFDYGDFGDWADTERIVPNVYRMYAELRGYEPTEGVDARIVQKQMYEYKQAGQVLRGV